MFFGKMNPTIKFRALKSAKIMIKFQFAERKIFKK